MNYARGGAMGSKKGKKKMAFRSHRWQTSPFEPAKKPVGCFARSL
ncbi:uncharacterized protein METZ01_LOCUS488445 [marine metagenome]|uniref:Uncharacterized protein n=1 Tax=marine metagenome TaxID=408172 RepID=A0A383CTX4_9ZZZZ